MKSIKKSVSSDNERNLEQQALIQFNATHYKEATDLYKELLAIAEDEQWRKKLADCYIQRALTFGARGMLKEALVLWESHCQYSQAPYQAYDHYIIWLIELNKQIEIQASLEQLSVEQIDKQYPALAAVLGMLILTEHPEYQQFLPQDSIFITHSKLVYTALQAYRHDNQKEVFQILQQLPYRSAYRDFRTLLSGALSIPEESEKAVSLFAKIPENSPYNLLVQLLESSLLDGSDVAKAFLKFNYKQRKVLGKIKGLNSKQLELLNQLFRHKHHLSDKVKFNLAIQNKALCGTGVAQQFCQKLLLTYPAGTKIYSKKFSGIDEFEENRLNALMYEKDQEGYEAEFYWKKCVQILIGKSSEDSHLKIALILRHMVNLQEFDDERAELLIESLKYDPEDHESYLQILGYYRNQPQTAKKYREWLKKTIDKFPDDSDVLSMAISAAIEKAAYKKASQYAKQLLNNDPLNSFAKQVMFSCHLIRAKGLIKAKKYHLVEKEIQQAEKINLAKPQLAKTQITRGLLCFFDKDKKQGLQLIAASLAKLNSDPVNTVFQASMEAQLTGLPITNLLRELSSCKAYRLTSQELTRFIQLLEEYITEGVSEEELHIALAKVKPSLKESLLQITFDENKFLTLCQLLEKINHFELLRHCTKIALKLSPNPIWKYYQLYAETNGMAERCQQNKLVKLELVREQAMKDKYYQAVVLMDGFIDRYYQFHPEKNIGFLDDFLGFDAEMSFEESNDPLDLLFDHIPENILLKLDKKLESLLRKTTPDMLLEQISKKLPNEEKIMSAIMQQPDLYMALLMCRAAEELGIDIDVSIKDVLEIFAVDTQTDLFTIPF